MKVFGVEENFDDVEATALAGIDAWDDWCRSIGMPVTLTELLGFTPTEEQLEEMAEKAAAVGGGKIGLFQSLDKNNILEIYKNAL